MLVKRKYIIVSVSLSITMLLASCSDSKVAQCERLVKQVSQGTALLEKNKGSQVTTSLQLAKDLQDVTKKVSDLKFGDEKLQELQSKFVKIFENLSQNIDKAGLALGAAKSAQATASGRETIQKARGDIDTSLKAASDSAKQFDVSVTELNQYCSKPES
jgi:TolA-binding protein